MLGEVLGRRALLVARVQLYLVDRGRGQPGRIQRLEVRHEEVGDADGAGEPLLARRGERLPRLDVEAARGGGPVDEDQVDRGEAEPVEAPAHRLRRPLATVVVVPDLGGDEELVARDAGRADRPPDALLVAVHGRGVDVPVADLERLGDDPLGVSVRHLVRAHAELRDRDAVAHRDRRDGGAEDPAAHAPNRSTSVRFRILPLGPSGSASTTSTRRGYL